MLRRAVVTLIVAGVMAGSLTNTADARVVRIVVERTTPYAAGRSFGAAGAFERLEGRVYMAVDSNEPLNAVVVNLDRAPRNAHGLVEFSAPFVIIRPVDRSRGNGKILYGINNRGNAIEIPFQTFPTLPAGADPETGDGLFFRKGYTFVDAGWAGDIITTETRLGADLPVAAQADGSPIVSRIRVQYPTDSPSQVGGERGILGYTPPLKGTDRFVSYETADTRTASSTLTVRNGIDAVRRTVPSDRWAFGTCPSGEASLTATTYDICLFEGLRRDHVYELTYPAKNPWVMGLGYAVTRDLASFLRYETVDDEGSPNPLAASDTAVGILACTGWGSHRPGCISASSSTSASTKMRLTGGSSTRFAFTYPARTDCLRTSSSRIRISIPDRTGRPISRRSLILR